MSYKFDIMVTILNKLDRGEQVTVNSLVNDVEMKERTVLRYIQTLKDAGFPIRYNRIKDSYEFAEGYSLRKLSLNIEENLAFSLAKKMLGTSGAAHMAGLLDKIEGRLTKGKTDLPRHIVLTHDTRQPATAAFLGTILQAIPNFNKLELTYRALYSGETTNRVVDPYYVFLDDGFWSLRAYCNLREDFRTFAVDRIQKLKVQDKHFLPKKIDPDTEFAGSFGSIVDGEPAHVVLRFDPEIRAYVERRKWHQSQQTKELPGGKLEMSFQISGYEGIVQWIYRWIPYIEVVAPKDLRKKVGEALNKAVAKIARSQKSESGRAINVKGGKINCGKGDP